MDAFLNLGLFLIAFYLMLLYAGWPDRRRTHDDRTTETARGVRHGARQGGTIAQVDMPVVGAGDRQGGEGIH